MTLESPRLQSLLFEMHPHWGFTRVRSRRVWIKEIIHEWVTLEDGEFSFDIFVKEFGREMHSAQAHPETCHEESLCRMEETSVSKGVNGGGYSEVVSESIMVEVDREGTEVDHTGGNKDEVGPQSIVGPSGSEGVNSEEGKDTEVRNVKCGSKKTIEVTDSCGSDYSYPFPPGFGSCIEGHTHRNRGKHGSGWFGFYFFYA
ncbi:hypothetical protein PIB30_056711 [Stylosanthes scabra]|uniref:Uncharacterized protein n=1 Tax=Stylosanthes scabra TaxID=79078 RepID=A0ABU6UJW7_9FABA|nr:hypothetical protein [Stylosanthes scabra]